MIAAFLKYSLIFALTVMSLATMSLVKSVLSKAYERDGKYEKYAMSESLIDAILREDFEFCETQFHRHLRGCCTSAVGFKCHERLFSV